jgi:hypothetical protein
MPTGRSIPETRVFPLLFFHTAALSLSLSRSALSLSALSLSVCVCMENREGDEKRRKKGEKGKRCA